MTLAEAEVSVTAAKHTLHLLQVALVCAEVAMAPKTLKRIRLAISSAKGAVRNARNRRTKEISRGKK